MALPKQETKLSSQSGAERQETAALPTETAKFINVGQSGHWASGQNPATIFLLPATQLGKVLNGS